MEARTEYETVPGTTFQELAERLNCTHQNVSKRARKEGWVKADQQVLEVAKNLDVSKPVKGSKLGKRSPENIAKIINVYKASGNKTLAARSVGIDVNTLANWCKECPDLLVEMSARRADSLANSAAVIESAKDPKIHWQRLAHASETREQYGTDTNTGTTIVLNIQRD